ncbi:replicative DNA helicase [Helicobacter felis]|uniref:replicative DNA helicase n=1 Tax=Helicobacter felis TaxID=214 RepID=UPI000CF14611|nr:replicative DNA helicase [Helicobacter felis]
MAFSTAQILPPKDDFILDMERMVLAAVLEGDCYENMAALLKPSDFFHPIHGLLFQLCGQLHQENLPIDGKILLSKLSSEKDRKILFEVMATSPVVHLEPYIEAIKQESMRRSLLRICMDGREQCYAQRPSAQILDNLEREIYALSVQSVRGGFKDAPTVVKTTMDMIYEAKLRGNSQILGLDTGFSELNRYTAGFQKGDLIVVGARPAMGKTSFVLNITQTALSHNKGVAFFSMEMGAEQLMLRLLSSLASVHAYDLKMGRLQDYEWEKLTSSAQILNDKSLFIDDTSMLTLEYVRSKMRQIKAQHPEIALVIIDYIQLMSSNHTELPRHAQISEISRGLKVLARELEIPIIALSQLNRSLESREDKRPILSDLKESGAIEQDADQVLFLYRDEVYKHRAQNDLLAKLRKDGKHEEVKKLEVQIDTQRKEEFQRNQGVEDAEIILAKNRNGDIGTIRVAFNKPYTRFEDRKAKDNPPQEEVQPTKFTPAPASELTPANELF